MATKIEGTKYSETAIIGSGAQEVPPVDTTATAACTAVLNSGGSELTVECAHNVEGVVAAHVHQGAAGSNGPVLFPFDDPASPFSQTFAVTADDVADLLILGRGGGDHGHRFIARAACGQKMCADLADVFHAHVDNQHL